mmetsp:Transcript_136773/g.248735  ORF Transcript_136773/g.248735 Transcript_136773/m.248735 type:complete len:112 (+) Transcript_136773:2209-2544(+)
MLIAGTRRSNRFGATGRLAARVGLSAEERAAGPEPLNADVAVIFRRRVASPAVDSEQGVLPPCELCTRRPWPAQAKQANPRRNLCIVNDMEVAVKKLTGLNYQPEKKTLAK